MSTLVAFTVPTRTTREPGSGSDHPVALARRQRVQASETYSAAASVWRFRRLPSAPWRVVLVRIAPAPLRGDGALERTLQGVRDGVLRALVEFGGAAAAHTVTWSYQHEGSHATRGERAAHAVRVEVQHAGG
jgi:hypothetical protein